MFFIRCYRYAKCMQIFLILIGNLSPAEINRGPPKSNINGLALVVRYPPPLARSSPPTEGDATAHAPPTLT